MTIWEWAKNNLVPQEEEIIVEEKTEQQAIQEILNKFTQPIPTNNFNEEFIKIETEHVCSTKPNWENKPLSERYSLTHKGEWIQIDIPHTILEKLELEKGKDITHPFYLDPNVLTRSETYKGITIEKEEEIFLERSFTIKNLDKDISKLFEKIEKLEEEKKSDKKTIEDLKNELEKKERDENDLNDKYSKEQEKAKKLEEKLKQWTDQFPEQIAENVKSRLLTEEEKKTIKDIITALCGDEASPPNRFATGLWAMDEEKFENTINIIKGQNNCYAETATTNPDLPLKFKYLRYSLWSVLKNYKSERFWWDKWIADASRIKNFYHGIASYCPVVNARIKEIKENCVENTNGFVYASLRVDLNKNEEIHYQGTKESEKILGKKLLYLIGEYYKRQVK